MKTIKVSFWLEVMHIKKESFQFRLLLNHTFEWLEETIIESVYAHR